MITYTLVRLNNKLKNYIFKVILFFVQQQKKKRTKYLVQTPESRLQRLGVRRYFLFILDKTLKGIQMVCDSITVRFFRSSGP